MEKQVAELEDKGNGHSPASSLPQDVKNRLSMGANAQQYGTQNVPNALNMLVQPGNKVENALMRVAFKDRAERIAVNHILALDKQFGDIVGEEELFNNIASTVSEHGEGRKELVQAIIGDRNVKMGDGFGDRLKRAVFGGNKDSQSQ